MNFSSKPHDQPLLGEGGVKMVIPSASDQFESLDDLMKVVEALCPRWPEREPFQEVTHWKL